MLSNIGYRLTAFADYSNLAYSQENVSKVLRAFQGMVLLPVVITEQIPGTGVLQRMRFMINDGFIINILTSRIDIEGNSLKQEGFSPDERGECALKLVQCMANIYDAFESVIQDANRLAWGANFVYFDVSEAERQKFRERFLKPLHFYDDISTDEFYVTYAGRKSMMIDSRNEEQMNILASINRYVTNIPLSPPEIVDGYMINFDINTMPENKKNRFGKDSLKSFVEVAKGIQAEVAADVLNDCH